MIVALSDTHRDSGTGLAGRAREAVAEADAVLHAGDFTSEAVLDAFEDLGPRLHAVHGNRCTSAVRDRLPSARTVDLDGVTVALTHRERGGQQALSLFGRERGADLVVSGHTHEAAVAGTGPVLLNPGSHDDPRGGRATHAELASVEGGLRGSVVARDGTRMAAFDVDSGEP